MLSVQPLESAKGAADYYAAAFNYYAGDATALRWLGKGAEHLGLKGLVEKEQMLQLLEGQLPNGQVLQNKKGEHRPGFDMTFSAPKSVSILVGLGVDSDLESFHDLAVELAIKQIEEEFAQTRIVKDGTVFFKQTNNLVIAAFRQPSSRANDPALHTHCVTMNMTFDDDNKARSLASDIHGNRGVVEQLQRHVTYAGLLYRTHLANMLKEKGYQLTSAGDGLFEIAHMPDDVLKAFSIRREEIVQYMQDHGWEGAKAASAATLITRDNKEEHDIQVLRDTWKTRADELGFDGDHFVKEALSHQDKRGLFESIKDTVFGFFYKNDDLERLAAREAVDVAIEIVSQKTSVFELRQLKEHALKHTLTGHSRISSHVIDEVIQAKITNQSLYVGYDMYTKKPVLTTPWLLTLEAESLARIEVNKGSVVPITTQKEVADFQNAYDTTAKYRLTPSQKQAMTQFVTTSDRYMAIQGYAGVGKTTLLKLTRELAESAGFQIRGIAVNSSAANELKIKGGIHADVFPVVHGELMKATPNSLQKTVFVVDEASMLSSPQGHELIKLIEKKGARLFMIGDDAQLPSVKNGRIFGLSQDYGIQTTEMVDNIRQQNQQLKEAVHHAIDGELYDAVQKINEVRELKTHEQRVETIAQKYLHLSSHVREHTLLFAPTHANRRDITAIIRDGLKQEGTLGETTLSIRVLKTKALEEVQLHHAQYYSKGDVIRFNHQSKRYGIAAGDYVTVDNVNKDNIRNNMLRLMDKDGRVFNFRLNELPAYKSTRAGFTRHIEVYQQEQLELAEGDRILWTRNFKKEGIVNSERAQITAIREKELHLVLDNGECKSLPRDHVALNHMDHGYVFTNIKVQGKDKMYGIGLMESYNKFSATLKNFYVQISRSIHHMTLITDDKNNLIRALDTNDDTKKAAIDFVTTTQLAAHQTRFATSSHSMDLNQVIERKGIKEDAVHQFIHRAEQYREAKNANHVVHSAKIAHDIISNKTLYRLAQSHLGYGYLAYRNDAHRLATLKLSQSLSIDEKKCLHTVRDYVQANQRTKTAWRQALEINPTATNKAYASELAMKRNALAHTIASNINAYKPYLKHYSLGELNRLGIPQHLYEKQQDKAISRLEMLTKQAGIHQINMAVRQFFSEEQSSKPLLAFDIKSHSKIAHQSIILLAKEQQRTPDVLWKDINLQAREHADDVFKKALPESHQKAFDSIKQYKTLGFELSLLWKEQFQQLEKNQSPKTGMKEKRAQLTALRQEIASIAVKDKTYLPLLNYFKIDREKLTQQAEKKQLRDNVMQFASSASHFKNKIQAAQRIASDVKGHYPYIKDYGVQSKQLNQYIRYVTRQELYVTLSEPEVTDYQSVLRYKYESKQAAKSWKTIFALKEQKIKPTTYQVNRALEFTAKRDDLASKLSSSTQYASYIAEEKISQEKINAQSKSHQERVAQIKKIRLEQDTLLVRLEQKASIMTAKEASAWHCCWGELTQKTTRILNSKQLFSYALKECPLGSMALSEQQKAILERYELNTQHIDKNNQVQQTKKWHNPIDITATNEALIANPARTYRAIFGEPKSQNSREMRYSGGLIVSLKGSKSGLWFDFGSGEGGSPLQAIMKTHQVTFKDALIIASELAGTRHLDLNTQQDKPTKTTLLDEKKGDKNKILSAKSIMKGCIPIKNTLAERYLVEHRKIENPSALNVKFWPENTKWLNLDSKGNLVEKINKIPALVIAAQNEKGELTGVQRIYLDEKTAHKNTFMDKAKISKGIMKSSAAVLQKGAPLGTVYITEGPETGASIAMAKPNATVLVAFGLSNIQNLSKLIKSQFPKEVVIAGDNDSQVNSNTLKLTEIAQASLKKDGINCSIMMPKQIGNLEKTDWNDVLKMQGVDEIRIQLNGNNTQSYELKINANILIEQLNPIEKLFEKHLNSSSQKIAKYVAVMTRDNERAMKSFDKMMPSKTHESYTKTQSINEKSIDNLMKKNELGLEI